MGFATTFYYWCNHHYPVPAHRPANNRYLKQEISCIFLAIHAASIVYRFISPVHLNLTGNLKKGTVLALLVNPFV